VPDCKNEQGVKTMAEMGMPTYGHEPLPPIPFGWTELCRMEEHDPFKEDPFGQITPKMLEIQGNMMGDAGTPLLDMADQVLRAQKLSRPKPIPIVRKYLVCDLHLLPIAPMK
jgi:hypothetical protein